MGRNYNRGIKVTERVIDRLIRERFRLDEMQFGFVDGRSTTDTTFLFRKLQEKYPAKDKPLYMAFVDLEKAFNWIPHTLIWWALGKQRIDEWLVSAIRAMYRDFSSKVRIGHGYSEEFKIEVEEP